MNLCSCVADSLMPTSASPNTTCSRISHGARTTAARTGPTKKLLLQRPGRRRGGEMEARRRRIPPRRGGTALPVAGQQGQPEGQPAAVQEVGVSLQPGIEQEDGRGKEGHERDLGERVCRHEPGPRKHAEQSGGTQAGERAHFRFGEPVNHGKPQQCEEEVRHLGHDVSGAAGERHAGSHGQGQDRWPQRVRFSTDGEALAAEHRSAQRGVLGLVPHEHAVGVERRRVEPAE